jgi:ribosomal protein S18 acetylase RimI-like enzyme
MIVRAQNMPVTSNQNSPVVLIPAQQSDLDNLVAHNTHYIEVSGERVGFVVVKHHHNELLLDHLYVRPSAQGSGIGSAVLTQICKEADAAALPIRVGALKESASNRFYSRHGFQFVGSSEFDNYYVRQSVPPVGAVC